MTCMSHLSFYPCHEIKLLSAKSHSSLGYVIRLNCGHIFHAECIKDLMKHGWSTLRVSFDFLSCPACKAPINQLKKYPVLQKELQKLLDLKAKVHALAEKVILKKKIEVDGKATKMQQLQQAMKKCAFYQCFTCKKPFFGGE